jgi:hypothetical protein
LKALSRPDRKELITHHKLKDLRESLRQFLGNSREKKHLKKTLRNNNIINKVASVCCEIKIKKDLEK